MIVPIAVSAVTTDACSAGTPAGSPIRALVERLGGAVRVRLIGEARRPLTVRYALAVAAGGNRATQGGSARLAPNVPATLLDLSQSAGDDWAATLDVWVEGGPTFHVPLCVGGDGADRR